MYKTDEGRIVETPREARQAEPGPSVLVLLITSVALAALALGGVWPDFLPDLTRANRSGGSPTAISQH